MGRVELRLDGFLKDVLLFRHNFILGYELEKVTTTVPSSMKILLFVDIFSSH